MPISYFTNALKLKPEKSVELEEVVEMVKEASRELKEAIELLRVEPDDSVQTKMKKLLPAVSFSGEFKSHDNKSLIAHSGLYIYDIDDMRPLKGKKMLNGLEHLVMAFASPRGNGLKVVLAGPVATDLQHHKEMWKIGANIVENTVLNDIDKSGGEVSRLCFLSSDPKAIYRPDAIPFKEKKDDFNMMGDVPMPKSDFKDYRIEQVHEMLWFIGSDLPYDVWRNIIYSVTSHLGKDDQVHDLLLKWCKDCGGDRAIHDVQGEKLFESIFLAEGKGVTLATLIKTAKDAGWRDWRKMLRRDEEGKLIHDDANLRIVLENHPDFKGRFWSDSITKRLIMDPIKEPIQAKITKNGGQIEEPLAFDILCDMQKYIRLGFRNVKNVMLAATAISKHNERNMRKEWLESLPEWDGKPRIEKLFIDGFGAKDTESNAAVGASFLCCAVARMIKPGSQVNVIPILVGDQGIGKSTGIAALLPKRDWFCDSFVDLETKNGYELVMRAAIVELNELSGMKKAEIERVKQFVSQNHVTFRAPYERQPADHPATWVFIGTTNEEQFLKDTTGNRRFAPIKVQAESAEKVVNWVKQNREQLWAEALAVVTKGLKDGKDTWNVGKKHWDDLAKAAEDARERDPWEDAVHDVSARLQCEKMVVRSLPEFAMECNITTHGRMDELHLGRLMRKWGWAKRHVRCGSKLGRRWVLNPIR